MGFLHLSKEKLHSTNFYPQRGISSLALKSNIQDAIISTVAD